MSTTPPYHRQAVALRYEANAMAPRVVAKAEGFMAQALIDRAQAAGVPLNTAPELLQLLMKLDLNHVIPPDLYAVVAQVLVWAYSVDERDATERTAKGLTVPPQTAP
jgi:flagellar biosynthesis protein